MGLRNFHVLKEDLRHVVAIMLTCMDDDLPDQRNGLGMLVVLCNSP
jgi:hypothetical protein